MIRKPTSLATALIVLSLLFAVVPSASRQPAAASPAAPVVMGFQVSGSTTASASLVLDAPSGITVGELLLLIVGNDDRSAGAEFTDNLVGWNYIGTSGDATCDADIGAFWRIADGTEGSTVTVTATSSDEWYGWYIRISGADTTNPINAGNFAQSSSSSDSHVVPEVTTTVADCLAIYALSFDGGDGYPFSVTGTGWSESAEYQTGTSGWSDVSGCWGTKEQASAGSTGDATVGCTVSDGAAYFQLAIAPAPAEVVTVDTTGTQTEEMGIPSTHNYVGGAFTFVRNIGTANVTQIIITDNGTVNANAHLSNVDIYYETAATCEYNGNETLFGTAASFNASEKATVSGTMSVGTSQVCVYVVLDVGSGAADGNTIEIEISNPSTEVTVSEGTVSPSTAVAISGTTTLHPPPGAPTVGSITISPSPMTPQYEWTNITVPVTDNDTLADVNKVNVTVFYDSAGNDPSAPGTANVQTCAILTWTRGGSPEWDIAPTSTTWAINAAGCSNGTDSLTTDDWIFSFKVGKVATHSTEVDDWDIYANATDSVGQTGDNYLRDVEMNWYGEITLITTTIGFGTVAAGSNFDAAGNNVTDINATYIANGAYDEKVAASSPWTGPPNATLNVTEGTLDANEFALKANDSNALASAVLVTISPTYNTTANTGTQTTESGDNMNTNTQWIKLAATFTEATYNGTIYYQIAQGS